MATTTRTTDEKTTNAGTADSPELAGLREQLLAGVTSAQQLSLDALRTWSRGVSALSRSDAAAGVGTRAAEGATSATELVYDLAADVLHAQREVALSAARTLGGRAQA